MRNISIPNRKQKTNYAFRMIKAHQRLYVSIFIGISIALLSPFFGVTSKITQSIIGYDSGVIIYIAWALIIIFSSTPHKMRQRALTQDEGKYLVLALVSVALIFSFSVIFADLAAVKKLAGAAKYESIFISLVTIVSSWFFFNLVFALHYAHDYYFEIQNGQQQNLIFLPESVEPDYFDFLYFSFTLGATAQTADVTLSSKKMRRTCLLHSILAFFFNTTLLALTINIASGLF